MLELVSALASAALLVASVVWLRPSNLAVGIVLSVAIALGAIPAVIDALAGHAEPDAAPAPPVPTPPPSVTTVVRVGGEPLELVRASLVLATRGPTVMVTTGRTDLDAEAAVLGVPIFRAETIEGAVAAAAATLETHAVLMIDPSTAPILAACRAEAARLTGRCAWVVGEVRSLADDSYAPDTREMLGARLRACAQRAGLDAWERNAMLLRTDVLRDHPIESGRPLGRWLRSLRSRGYEGALSTVALSVQAAPAGAPTFWPATVTRQRALAADLSDAMTSGPSRARLLAFGLLVRELYAVPVAIWFLAPLLIGLSGEFPFRCPAEIFVALLAMTAVARWATIRAAHDVALHPVDVVVAGAFDAPGSIGAVVPAVTRRVRPVRARVSARVLLWGGLALSTIAVLGLAASRGLHEPREVAVGLALASLGLLFVLTLRALAERRWARGVMRIAVALPATIDGRSATTVDVSPSGVALAGALDDVPLGAAVGIEVLLPGGDVLRTSAVVTDHRRVAGRMIVGCSLQPDPVVLTAWTRGLFDELRLGEPDAALPRVRRAMTVEYRAMGRAGRAVRVLDGVATALVALVAVVIVVAVGLSVLGYRMLVLRSDSMVPTLATGDVIVVEEVPIGTVMVGDVVTVDDPDGGDDSVTHRVVRIERDGDHVRLTTRGDANPTGEHWALAADDTVGLLRWDLPRAGEPALWLDANEARGLLIGVGGVLAVAVIVRARLGHRARRRAA